MPYLIFVVAWFISAIAIFIFVDNQLGRMVAGFSCLIISNVWTAASFLSYELGR